MTNTEVIVAVLGAIVSLAVAVGGWQTGKAQASRQSRTDDAKGVDARWQSMLQEQRNGFDAQLTPMREDIEDLRGQVSHLRTEVHAKDFLIATLTTHLRAVMLAWRGLLPNSQPPLVPESIRHLI